MEIENNRAANLISQSRYAQTGTNHIQAMSELNLKAYCINLDSETNRKLHCTKEYEKAGIDFEFSSATDGRNEDVQPRPARDAAEENQREEIDAVALTIGFFNRGTNSPERACAQSHLDVWKKIAETNSPSEYFLVNEDDFYVKTTRGLAEAIIELQRFNFDLVYLGHRGGAYRPREPKHELQKIWHMVKFTLSPKSKADLFRRNLVLHAKPRKLNGSKHFHQAGMTWGGHAYLLNSEGARKLITINENLRFLPDEAFRFAILNGGFRAAMSKVKYFGCDTQFGSALRDEDSHEEHHKLYPSD